jgi:alpha-L-rhamnosidase
MAVSSLEQNQSTFIFAKRMSFRLTKFEVNLFPRILRHTLLAASLILLSLYSATAKTSEVKPKSPTGLVSVADFGAVGDGATLNTEKFQSVIDQLAARGGGTLIVPRGVFLSGAIFLKPGVNLFLEDGAVIKGSTNVDDYPKLKTRVEGHFEEWLPALINADKCDHLRISGKGTLDGNGAPFWREFGMQVRTNRSTKNLDVPRPRLAFIQNSDDVRISGITFKDSGFWNLHLYHCRNVVVEKARFEVPVGARAPSTDGTDIDSCQNVTIRGCSYRVNDDCICLKGSKGPFAMLDKDSPPVSHIRVSDCTFERGDGVMTLGSEATVVRDVVMENCRVNAVANFLRLKLRPDTPQLYEDVHCHNITLDGAGAILQVQPWRQYFDLQGQLPPKSVVRDVTIANVKGKYGSLGVVKANPGQTTISDITLKNFDVQLKTNRLNAVDAKNLKLKNVVVNGKPYSL